MRIATYNVWNENKGIGDRIEQILGEIMFMADIELKKASSVINIINTARENASFGDSFIDSIAEEIQTEFPGIKGFNRRGLYRMKPFYETYYENKVVSPLVTQISWTNVGRI